MRGVSQECWCLSLCATCGSDGWLTERTCFSSRAGVASAPAETNRVSRKSGSVARRRASCEATPARHVESRSESLAVAALQHGRASMSDDSDLTLEGILEQRSTGRRRMSTALVVLAVDTGVVVIVVAIAVVLVVLFVTVSMRGRQRREAQRRGEARRDVDDGRERVGRPERDRDSARERAEDVGPDRQTEGT